MFNKMIDYFLKELQLVELWK